MKSQDHHHRNSKSLNEYTPKGKHEASELEKVESPNSSSTELWKDEISKEIEELKQQLHKKQAVFAALTSGRLSHSWPHQRPSCSCQTTPPPTPLVDALTIELFDSGSLSHRNNKTIETLRNLTNSETYNRDHAISCPALDEKSNLVAGATQTDRLGCHLSYGYLNSSNSSSTSGVIDVDLCSSSSRSQDGRKKRKNFIRSSHRFESDSQTSQSMESNPETNISLPRQRSPSFRAAIESHSNNCLQAGSEDAQLIRRNHSFMAAVGSHGAANQQHNETVHLTRNRSLSFQAAIEDGQQSPRAENNDTDFISTGADTTPENQNVPEGFTLGTHGRVVLPSGRQDSRSVNFQLSHVNSYSGVDLQAVGNLQQSSKAAEDSKNSHSSHNSQKKSEEWKKSTRTVPNPEVEVTYASPTASIESSGSDVPKKSCIRDSSQRLNSSTEGVQSSSTNEASPKSTSTAVTMENSSTPQPSSPRHSRTRRMSAHTLDVAKETLISEEKSDPKMLKLTANKEKLLSLQKQKEAMSSSTKAAGDVTTNKNLASLETAVKDTNKPDDISNNAVWAPDSISQLSKLRENNLARKREQMKHMKMPELTELAENPSESSETSKGTSVVNSSGATFTQPPPPTDNMVLPSIPDSFLMELGLFVDQYANFCCEDLSEQETENKFLSLSLAFKTDKLTLNQRLQIQKNSRDLAEENIQKELNSLKEVSESMVQQTNDPQVREAVNNIQHYVEVLQQAVARISGRAEVFGAVQQEQRMSQAMEVMLAYVENLKRMQERDHLELEEAKKALTENKILTLEDGGDSSTLPRRTASLFNTPSKTAKRRASVAAVSKNPVPVGSTPGNQASMNASKLE